MKLLRFIYRKKTRLGIFEKTKIREIKNKSIFERPCLTQRLYRLEEIKILPPVIPSKIVAVGLNYKDHARELNMPVPKEPVIFIKPATAIIGHEAFIFYPNCVSRLDYEAELAVVICKKAKNVRKRYATEHILGYTCFNDVTARDLQKIDIQWTWSKSFDTFAPIGPFIETDLNPMNLGIRLYKNGMLKQCSNTKNLIFSPFELVSFISGIMTLLPGDVIATGTPVGVGPMNPGDTVEVAIDGIGSLRNKVIR